MVTSAKVQTNIETCKVFNVFLCSFNVFYISVSTHTLLY
uniref:Uncharacterized protein n=1 Tax=Siphoviridae sp. ctmHK36 TaxID=2827931 RepID=A0A8S5TB00_9CAUD|nr:MAG TPA: hypothetical protein [Siphoviridae sp. ctmHK36]